MLETVLLVLLASPIIAVLFFVMAADLQRQGRSAAIAWVVIVLYFAIGVSVALYQTHA